MFFMEVYLFSHLCHVSSDFKASFKLTQVTPDTIAIPEGTIVETFDSIE